LKKRNVKGDKFGIKGGRFANVLEYMLQKETSWGMTLGKERTDQGMSAISNQNFCCRRGNGVVWVRG
jgi:hypothetical protein